MSWAASRECGMCCPKLTLQAVYEHHSISYFTFFFLCLSCSRSRATKSSVLPPIRRLDSRRHFSSLFVFLGNLDDSVLSVSLAFFPYSIDRLLLLPYHIKPLLLLHVSRCTITFSSWSLVAFPPASALSPQMIFWFICSLFSSDTATESRLIHYPRSNHILHQVPIRLFILACKQRVLSIFLDLQRSCFDGGWVPTPRNSLFIRSTADNAFLFLPICHVIINLPLLQWPCYLP